MAARIVTYFPKGAALPNQVATSLKALAYQATKDLGLEAEEVLIRGGLHDTTTINGKTAKDPLGYHSTISVRTADDIKNQTFTSLHAYTPGKSDFTLVKATPGAKPLPLTAKDRAGKLIWPQNIKQEAIVYVDPSEESTK